MRRSDRLPRNLGFFLILPDALAQELVPAIGGYLARYSLQPAGVATDLLDERHRAIMYDSGPRSKYSEKGRVHGREMTRRLLALDNCLAVLVTGPSRSEDVSRLLHDLKGQSSFLKRKPGSLRDLSASSDRCMSLIHTPDDAVEAARDAALFFAEISDDPDRGQRRLDWHVVSACRAQQAPSPLHSRYSIAVRLVLRCAALQLGNPELRRTDGAYRALWFIFDSCDAWLAESPSSVTLDEHDRFLSLCASLRPQAAESASACTQDADRDGMLTEIIQTLIDPDAFDHDEGLRTLERLKRARLMLSPYESHHLLTLMTFFHD